MLNDPVPLFPMPTNALAPCTVSWLASTVTVPLLPAFCPTAIPPLPGKVTLPPFWIVSAPVPLTPTCRPAFVPVKFSWPPLTVTTPLVPAPLAMPIPPFVPVTTTTPPALTLSKFNDEPWAPIEANPAMLSDDVPIPSPTVTAPDPDD